VLKAMLAVMLHLPLAGASQCRALDVDGRSIVEVEAGDALDCRRVLKPAVRRLYCDPDLKRFRFLIQYGDERPTSAEVFCSRR
jgi:hypothetical protein